VFTIIFLWINLVVAAFMAKKKSRNPIARLLKHFTPKRFKDKTKYSRKDKYGQTNRYYEDSNSAKTST